MRKLKKKVNTRYKQIVRKTLLNKAFDEKSNNNILVPTNFYLCDVNLKRLLGFLHTCFMLNQKVLMYYDIFDSECTYSHINKYLYNLCKAFEKIGIVLQYFIDFIPGFISNTFGEKKFITDRPDFNVFLFLNYNQKNIKHIGMVNDIITFKYEYMLISPVEIDLKNVSPYVGVPCMNLNAPNLFNFFFFMLETVYSYVREYKFKRDRILFKIFFAISLLKAKTLKDSKNFLRMVRHTPASFLRLIEPYFKKFVNKYKDIFLEPINMYTLTKQIQKYNNKYLYYYFQIFYNKELIFKFFQAKGKLNILKNNPLKKKTIVSNIKFKKKKKINKNVVCVSRAITLYKKKTKVNYKLIIQLIREITKHVY